MSPPVRVCAARAAGSALPALILAVAALSTGCHRPHQEPQSLRFTQGAHDVEVVFYGEVADAELFGGDASLLDRVRPRNEAGRPQGAVHLARPGWLRFVYRIDGETREVLIAKQPLLNMVSWNDIARAAAATGDDAHLDVAGRGVLQDARIQSRTGETYRVRLPDCGQATQAALSEWNLLIGAVHRGDMDFHGERYGWIRTPYRDEDLKVGYHGSLTWCRDRWRDDRVARGYFFVSRLHAAAPDTRTTRLHWRPVLEREVARDAADRHPATTADGLPIRWSPSKRVGYAGRIGNAALFGADGGVDRQLNIVSGRPSGGGPPDWLRFEYEGKSLLVAARPLRYALSWDDIARAGAARGDGSDVRIGTRSYRQDATVVDAQGIRYRVRLIGCGRSTQDIGSEWNALIGGVHRGDGDFRTYPDGIYGWLTPPFDDEDLMVGTTTDYGATWCRETMAIDGKIHAVNRGFFTVSRFHATETSFDGAGFAWRPVLEAMP